MSDTEYDRIPPLTLGWRLKMAMDWAGHERKDMAKELGVDPSTVSRWMNNDDAPPSRGYVCAWATFTHCDFQWLLTGEPTSMEGPPKRESAA